MGSNHCAIRWYELRDANDGNWTIYQQGTWNPDADDRFYGSIAMDMNGNIGLGYSVANADNDTYVGLRYTGRLASDPLGEMTFTEVNVVSGTGSQSGTNRFGDYAHMALDPDGQTFWFTGEYLGTNGGTRTRIFSFQVGVAGVEDGPTTSDAFSTGALLQGGSIIVDVRGADHAPVSSIEVIGIDGKRAMIEEIGTPNGSATARLDASGLAQGVWFVRVINGKEQRVRRIVWNGIQ